RAAVVDRSALTGAGAAPARGRGPAATVPADGTSRCGHPWLTAAGATGARPAGDPGRRPGRHQDRPGLNRPPTPSASTRSPTTRPKIRPKIRPATTRWKIRPPTSRPPTSRAGPTPRNRAIGRLTG